MSPVAAGAAIAPAAFVVIWSTGFVGTKIGLRDAAPLTLLALRFAVAVAVIWPIVWAIGAKLPRSAAAIGHLVVAGLLNNAFYLALSYEANYHGMPVSMIALIGSLQPVLTAIGATWLLGERVDALRWTGLSLGLAGVVLVLADRVAFAPSWPPVAFVALSLACITAGTLYQKRFCGEADLVAGSAVQFSATFVALALGVLLLEPWSMRASASLAGSVVWLALVNSVLSINLFYWLIRRGQASRVVSLLYLVPPVTSAMAYFWLGERFGEYFVIGSLIAMAGVALVTRRARADSGQAAS